jgi:hypothetical protein
LIIDAKFWHKICKILNEYLQKLEWDEILIFEFSIKTAYGIKEPFKGEIT